MRTHLTVTDDFGLIPTDDEGIKYVYNRKPGDVIECNIRQCRNIGNHRRFFAFIKTTFDMQDSFDNIEYYRYWLTMKAGYFDTIQVPSGKTIYKAHSLEFGQMPEDEFKKVFNNSIDVFLKTFGGDMTQDELLQIVGFV